MESPQRVIIPFCRIVKIPPVSCVVAFHQVHIFPHPVFIHRQPVFQETDVHQDPEKTPVVFRHVIQVDLVQPVKQMLTLACIQRIPEEFRYKAQAASDDRHFHHPLIIVTDVSPVFLMFRIRSMDHALLPQRPEGLRFTALPHQHRNQCPQRPTPAFHSGHVFGIMGRSVSDVDTGFSRRHAGCQWLQDCFCRLHQVPPCAQ